MTIAAGEHGRHIVHLANFYGPRSGGLRTTLQAIGRGYRAAGHRFTVIVPGPADGHRRQDFGEEYTIAAPTVPGTGGYRVILRYRAVIELLQRIGPDRIELSDRTTLHRVGRWARRRSIPTVFFAHERVDGVLGSVRIPHPLATRVADLRNRGTARDFDSIVATTGFAAEEFERIGADNLRRIALGVDLETFRPCPDRTARPEVTGTVRNRRLDLLLCSRLSVEKAPELAVGALIELVRRGVDAQLTVLGDGPRRAALQEQAAGYPVTFLGFVADRDLLARRLSGANIALAPGPIETFGLAALECLASGTPVVVNSRSALPEVLGDDPSAGASAADDPAAFADAVIRLAGYPERQRRAAARGRAEQLPWSATVASLLALHGAAITPEPTGEPESTAAHAQAGAPVRQGGSG